MMENEIVLSAKSLSKTYRLYVKPQDRLKHQLLHRFGVSYGHDFHALEHVSFNVRRGEMLGIIGRNGAGKSTLLQILTGVLQPTHGTVSVKGRMAALLELGSGFDPESSGRDNVFINGSILGIPQRELDERFDEIAAFADIGEFMEQPVKMYSTGMFVRLAFAIHACLDPDILIVDEALSVGDVFFQQKCYARIEKLLAGKTAVILVTHDMSAVTQMCDTTLVLNKGKTEFYGSPTEGVRRYFIMHHNPEAKGLTKYNIADLAPPPEESTGAEETGSISHWPAADAFMDFSASPRIGEDWARCVGIALCDDDGNPCNVFKWGRRANFYYEFEAMQDLLTPIGIVLISTPTNLIVHGKATYMLKAESFPHVPKGSRVRIRQTVELNIQPGEYVFSVGLNMMSAIDYAALEHLAPADFPEKIIMLGHVERAGSFSVTYCVGEGVSVRHQGLCDLPGACEMALLRP